MSLLLPFGVKSQGFPHSELPSSSGFHHVNPSMVEDKDLSRSWSQSYASCFGLPYQDHNYGAPPPPTPPVSPPPPTPPTLPKINGHIDIDDVSCHTTVETTAEDDKIVTPEDSVTRCICEFQHDDGYMICCDRCGVWQHVDCMAVDRLNIPDIYYCEKCEPRKFDKHRAIQLQTKRRELLLKLDSSATDTEDETPQGKKKKKDKAKHHKSKGKKDKKDNTKLLLKSKLKLLKPHKDKLKDLRKPELTPLIINRKQKSQTSPLTPKKKKIKSPRSMSLDEVEEDMLHDAWSPEKSVLHNGMLSPVTARDTTGFLDDSQDNQYSIEIETLLVGNKLNGGLSPQDAFPAPSQLLVQLCKVTQITPSIMGLEATEDIPTNQPIIEYRGMVMMKSQYMRENKFHSNPSPHVLFYKYDTLELCVDSSTYNCEARNIRRSCASNVEIRHVVENGNLRFYIYSSRCISKDAELTIPFDFSYKECLYHVTCACLRLSCPIVKHYKNEELKTPLKLVRKRRRRSTKCEDPPVMSMGGETIPAPVAPVAPVAPIVAKSTPSVVKAAPVVARSASAVPKAAPIVPKVVKSPTRPTAKRRKRASMSEATRTAGQSEQKPSPPRTRHSEDSYSRSCALDTKYAAETVFSDTEPNEDPNSSHEELKPVMSREERKMDAILKAFEKMEKREERRKEALARIDTTRKPTDKPHSESNETEKHQDETTEDEYKPEKERAKLTNKKSKGKKKKTGTPARRQSRVSSSVSIALDSGTSADESCTIITPLTTPLPSDLSATPTPSCANADRAFRFPKTKKHRLSEWLHETGQEMPKPLSIKTDLSDVDSEETEFVKCVPSPHANSLSHLRRNSLSYNRGENHGKAVGSVNLQMDSNIGSAKKRWLRQAMFEHTGPNDAALSPIAAGSMSPNPSHAGNGSPNTSPLDFVTPLKKRRMARESISESPFPMSNTSLSPSPRMEGLDLSSDRLGEDEEHEEKVSMEADELQPNKDTPLDYRRFRNGLHPRLSHKESIFERLRGRRSRDEARDVRNESLDSSIEDGLMSPPVEWEKRHHGDDQTATSASDSEWVEKEEKPDVSSDRTLPHVEEQELEVKEELIKEELKEESDIAEVDVDVVDSDSPDVTGDLSVGGNNVQDDTHSVASTDSESEDVDVEHLPGPEPIDRCNTLHPRSDVSGGDIGCPSVSMYKPCEQTSVSSQSVDSVNTSNVDTSEQMMLRNTEVCTGSLPTSSCVTMDSSVLDECGQKTMDNSVLEDCGQPSSSSDPRSVEQSNCSDCSSLHNVKTDSFGFKFDNTNSAHKTCADSSEPSPSQSRTTLCVNMPQSSNICVEMSPTKHEECDSTNRDVGFEGLHRADNSEVGASSSCSSSESDCKDTELKSSSHSELSSSCDVLACIASDSVQEGNEVDVAGGSSPLQAHRESAISEGSSSLLPCLVTPSFMNTSSDVEGLPCSSSNSIDTISNVVTSCVQDTLPSDEGQQVCEESDLETRPKTVQCSSMVQADQSSAIDKLGPSQAEPSPSQAEPSPSQAEPASSQAEPASSQAEPASSQAEPVSSQAEPVSSQAEPVSSQAEPVSSQAEPLVTNSSGVGDQPDDGGISAPIVSSLGEVDSTQTFDPCRASSTSTRREEGELDSSMSDMERDLRSNMSISTSRLVSSSEAEAHKPLETVHESEKEEGEITDDETEEETALDIEEPLTSTVTSPVISTTSVAPTSTETSPTSSVSTLKYSTAQEPQSASPSSSSNVFRFSSTPREQRDQDWGTPYRGSNSISSSSNVSNNGNSTVSSGPSNHRERERYSDYSSSHRHSSSSSSSGRASRSYDRSPTCDDANHVDSSSSDRLRHYSEDSGNLDSTITSTGTDHTEESWRLGHDISPNGTPYENASPISSSSNLPAKKKMSLTEYKKRMKQKRPEPSRSSTSSGSNSGRTTPVVTKEPSNTNGQDLLAPLMPYFGTLGSSFNKEKVVAPPVVTGPLPTPKEAKEEGDVQWNASATMAERIREQTQLSLTERLRREFGLDASESEDDEEKRKDRRRHSSGGRPTSPVPPPPPPRVSQYTLTKPDDDSDSDPPPPPPRVGPVSYPQRSYGVAPVSIAAPHTTVSGHNRFPLTQGQLTTMAQSGMPPPGMPQQHPGLANHLANMPPPPLGVPPPQGMPPPLQGMPPPPQSMPPPQGMPPPLQGMPPPLQGMPLPPQGMPLPPQGMPLPPQGMPLPPQGMPLPPPGMPLPPPGMPLPPPGMPLPPPQQGMPPQPGVSRPMQGMPPPMPHHGITSSHGMPPHSIASQQGMSSQGIQPLQSMAQGIVPQSHSMPPHGIPPPQGMLHSIPPPNVPQAIPPPQGMPPQGVPPPQHMMPHGQGMPPHGQVMPPQGQGMPLQGQGMPPQGQGMPPQGQGMPPQGQGMPPQGQGMPPQGQGMPPQGQGMPPQGQGIPPQGQGMPPQGQGMPPQGQGMPPQGQGMPPQGQGMPPQGQGMPPQGQGMPPQGQGMPPQGQGMPPQGQGMPPQGQGMPPQGQGMPPQGQGMPPQGQGMPPQGQGMPPQGQGMPPQGQGLSLQGHGVPPPQNMPPQGIQQGIQQQQGMHPSQNVQSPQQQQQQDNQPSSSVQADRGSIRSLMSISSYPTKPFKKKTYWGEASSPVTSTSSSTQVEPTSPYNGGHSTNQYPNSYNNSPYAKSTLNRDIGYSTNYTPESTSYSTDTD